jgi:hypothetical protein
MGYVYLIEDSDNETYKIGVTRRNCEKRLRKLQTGNSTKLELKYIFETEYPFRLESILHNIFRDYKVLNEWYALPKNIVDDFLLICQNKMDIIYIMKDKNNPFFVKNLK